MLRLVRLAKLLKLMRMSRIIRSIREPLQALVDEFQVVVTSCHVVSCPVLSCPVLSCRVPSCRVPSCRAAPRRAIMPSCHRATVPCRIVEWKGTGKNRIDSNQSATAHRQAPSRAELAMQCNAMQCNAMQCNAMQSS